MFKPATATAPFRLRPASPAQEGGSASMPRVARIAPVARAAPVLQRQCTSGQMVFDFKR